MGYEHKLSEKQLQEEVRQMWDDRFAFEKDMANLPEVPSIATLRFLMCAQPRGVSFHLFWERGKVLQDKYGWSFPPYKDGTIPTKTEYEIAAGVWSFMREGLVRAIDQHKTEAEQWSTDDGPA